MLGILAACVSVSSHQVPLVPPVGHSKPTPTLTLTPQPTVAPTSTSQSTSNSDGVKVTDVIAVVLSFFAIIVSIVTVLYTARYVKTARKDLTLTAYNHAVYGILDLKRTFAEHGGTIFEEQMKRDAEVETRNPHHMSMKHFIPNYMQHNIPTFLAFAGGMWRFSYVYSVMQRWEELGMRKEEREGLEKEMRLWLEHVPGFRDIYKTHTSQLQAHNAEFLSFLKQVYDQQMLLEIVQALVIRKKPRYRVFRCTNCKQMLADGAWHHLLTSGGYFTQVHLCASCEDDFKNNDIVAKMPQAPSDTSQFELTCSQQTQKRLRNIIEIREKEATDVFKAFTCDLCGKELPKVTGYRQGWYVWRKLDDKLVGFHFDNDCYQKLDALCHAPNEQWWQRFFP